VVEKPIKNGHLQVNSSFNIDSRMLILVQLNVQGKKKINHSLGKYKHFILFDKRNPLQA